MTLASWVLGATTLWVSALLGLLVTLVLRLRQTAPATEPHIATPYILVRPCTGLTAPLYDNLLSAQQLAAPSPSLCVFVAPAQDPCLPVLRAVAAALLRANLRCMVLTSEPAPEGHNPKVAQLEYVWNCLTDPLEQQQPWVMADCDIDLQGFSVAQLLQALQKGAGAAWAPCYESVPPGGNRAAAAVLHASLQCFGLLGQLDSHCFAGATCAVKPAALRTVGGWRSLAPMLGEDMELAQRLRHCGMPTAYVPTPSMARPEARTWRQAVQRYSRWMWAIRRQRHALLWTYPLMFFPTFLILLLLASCSVQRPLWAGGLALACLFCRTGVALLASRCRGSHTGAARLALDAVWADATLAVAWIQTLTSRSVVWRGRRLAMGRPRCHGDSQTPRKRYVDRAKRMG